MKTFKFNELPEEFFTAVESIKRARKLESEARILEQSGKDYIKRFILEKRGIDINQLVIGDRIMIGGPEEFESKEFKYDLVLIEVNSQNKFDISTFQIDEPQLYGNYKKDMPIINYKF